MQDFVNQIRRTRQKVIVESINKELSDFCKDMDRHTYYLFGFSFCKEDFYCVLAIIGYSMMDGVIIDSVDKLYDNVIHNRYIWWEVKSSKPFIVFLRSCEIPSVVDKFILIDLGKRMITAYRDSFFEIEQLSID